MMKLTLKTEIAFAKIAFSESNAVGSVGDWLRGDNKGPDWRWGIAGYTGLSSAIGSANSLYAKKIIPRMAGAPVNLQERNIYRSLVEQARGLGTSVTSPKNSLLARYGPTQTISNLIRKLRGKEMKQILPGTSYSPLTREIILAKGYKSPGVLGHELGHVGGGKKLMTANILGKFGVGAATQLSLLSSNESTGRNIAGAGVVAGGGLLASELDASRRGYKAIRALGGGRGAAMKAFVGIPTYLGVAGMPAVAHATKKYMGGYDE